jgi:hypothetical protein
MYHPVGPFSRSESAETSRAFTVRKKVPGGGGLSAYLWRAFSENCRWSGRADVPLLSVARVVWFPQEAGELVMSGNYSLLLFLLDCPGTYAILAAFVVMAVYSARARPDPSPDPAHQPGRRTEWPPLSAEERLRMQEAAGRRDFPSDLLSSCDADRRYNSSSPKPASTSPEPATGAAASLIGLPPQTREPIRPPLHRGAAPARENGQQAAGAEPAPTGSR